MHRFAHINTESYKMTQYTIILKDSAFELGQKGVKKVSFHVPTCIFAPMFVEPNIKKKSFTLSDNRGCFWNVD